MASYRTVFGSIAAYEKGSIEIINDDPKHYVYSNVFEVVANAKPYEKIAVAKNLEYVIEAIRAEGRSSWMSCAHDEFVVVMDGEVEVELVKLTADGGTAADTPPTALGDTRASADKAKPGAVVIQGEPQGRRMGRIRLRRGHQALLPKGAAYRFSAARPAALIQQTQKGELTIEKWADICVR
jgi:hypothetical protein